MDSAQYHQYNLKIMFHCKNCTEKKGSAYTGHVEIFELASSNASFELETSDESPIMDALVKYITPPRPNQVGDLHYSEKERYTYISSEKE